MTLAVKMTAMRQSNVTYGNNNKFFGGGFLLFHGSLDVKVQDKLKIIN